MHPVIISGLSNLGTSLLEQTLGKIRNVEANSLNFNVILNHLAKTKRAESTFTQMRTELLSAIQNDPLLNEFRSSPHSEVSVSIDQHGRCAFKEDGEAILTCSKDSDLGKLGIAYFNLSQLSIPKNQQLTEIYLENIA